MQPAAGTLVFRCPSCTKAHRAMKSAAGKPITCSNCRKTFTVPATAAPAAAQPPAPGGAKTEPMTYWQPVAPATPQVIEPAPAPNDWMTAPEEEPVFVRKPKRRSLAIWKIAILLGHAALIAAAVAVWFILQNR